MFDLKLVLGIALTLIGLWLLADKLSHISQTLQYKPTVTWAFVMFAFLLVLDAFNIGLSDASNGLQSALSTYHMFIVTIVIMIFTAVILRTLPPHVLWPLWTGLGIAAPIIISILRGHTITPFQWVGVTLVVIATCFLCYDDISKGFPALMESET